MFKGGRASVPRNLTQPRGLPSICKRWLLSLSFQAQPPPEAQRPPDVSGSSSRSMQSLLPHLTSPLTQQHLGQVLFRAPRTPAALTLLQPPARATHLSQHPEMPGARCCPRRWRGPQSETNQPGALLGAACATAALSQLVHAFSRSGLCPGSPSSWRLSLPDVREDICSLSAAPLRGKVPGERGASDILFFSLSPSSLRLPCWL